MKRIAILGANGRLGNEVLQAFHQAGYQVTAVTRNGQVRNAPQGIKCVAADALKLGQLKKAVRGAHFIFNGLKPAYTDWVHAALPMARNVMAAARSTGAIHLFPGNLHSYGKAIPVRCDVNTPLQAHGVKGKVSIELEKLFALAAQKHAVKTLLVRAGDGYGGSGTGSWFDLALVEKLAEGHFVYPGPTNVVHSWAYLPDLADAFVALAEKHQQCVSYEAFLFPGHSLTGAEFQALVEQNCGKKLALLGMPWKLIKFGSLLVPLWREMTESAYLWSRPHRLDGGRLQQITGELTQTPPELAVRDALQALGVVP